MSGMTSKKWCFKANINIRRNELDEAIKCYDRAIQIDPTNLEAYIEKGNVFLNQKKLDQAANIYKKCLDIKPDFDIALSNLGTALSHQNKHEEAIIYYDKIIALNNSLTKTGLVNKGSSLKLLKRYDEALICFDKAIKLDPSFWGTYYGKIHTLSEIDKHEDVLKIIEDALKEISDDRYKYLIFTAKGDALFSLHRYHEGLAAYDVAIGYDKKYANAYIGKLKCLEALNIVGDADYYFKLLKSGYCHFNERGPAVMMECIPSQYLQ